MIREGTARLDLTLKVRYGNVFTDEVHEKEFLLTYDYRLKRFLRSEDIPQRRASHSEDDEEHDFFGEPPEELPPDGSPPVAGAT